MFKAIVIDDEKNARELLSGMLKLYCPDMTVVGEADGVNSGIEAIKNLKPDVVFLDIQMPDGTGFDLLKAFDSINFKYIFVTAYQEYAIRAFKFSAIDYLLKPVDPSELIVAVDKLQNSFLADETNQKFSAFMDNIQSSEEDPQKIVLRTTDSIIVAEKNSIIRCEAESNYTCFYFTDREKITVSKTLKEYEELLTPSGFFRVHQSHLVNMQFVKTYKRFPDSYVELSTGEKIPVSVRKRELVVKLLRQRSPN